MSVVILNQRSIGLLNPGNSVLPGTTVWNVRAVVVKRGSKFSTGEESLQYRTTELTPAAVTACPPHKQMRECESSKMQTCTWSKSLPLALFKQQLWINCAQMNDGEWEDLWWAYKPTAQQHTGCQGEWGTAKSTAHVDRQKLNTYILRWWVSQGTT